MIPSSMALEKYNCAGRKWFPDWFQLHSPFPVNTCKFFYIIISKRQFPEGILLLGLGGNIKYDHAILYNVENGMFHCEAYTYGKE